MAEWLVEEGIAEHRAVRMDGGAIAEARLYWPGRLTAGQVEDATLAARIAGSSRGAATFASGEEALVDRLPKNAAEGAPIRLEITRAAIGERGRLKRAQARPSDAEPCTAPSLTEALETQEHNVRIVHRFPAECDWDELFAEAWSGTIKYTGGGLLLADTPAMMLIDVDGPATQENACAAAEATALALRRFDIHGSIGIDFPTLMQKAERKAVDTALENALSGWPHERTAMNGFGFVQLVARLERPSLFQLVNRGRVGAAARNLMRQAEFVSDPGVLLLTCHPALKARLRDEWQGELNRRTGRSLRIETDPGLALNGGFAQAVSA